MNEDQIKLFKSFVPPPVQKKEITAEPQKFRTLAQGLSFGFSDEIEAAVRSLVPESMGGKDYEVIRNELRSKLKDYKEQNSGEAITLEVAGAFLPSIAMAMTGFGAPAAAINLTRAGQLARTAKIAAVEGGVTSIGESEGTAIQRKGRRGCCSWISWRCNFRYCY
jgi:hypothetical protein